MKTTLFFTSLLVGLAIFVGCNPSEPTTLPNNATSTANPPSGNSPNAGTTNGSQPTSDADNTGVNVRDRADQNKTPIDQNENQKDINITAEIRSRIVDTKMSINAQNVKVITQDGRVTLRGPVKSADEKTRIEEIAVAVAGKGNVDNQIEVESNP